MQYVFGAQTLTWLQMAPKKIQTTLFDAFAKTPAVRHDAESRQLIEVEEGPNSVDRRLRPNYYRNKRKRFPLPESRQQTLDMLCKTTSEDQEIDDDQPCLDESSTPQIDQGTKTAELQDSHAVEIVAYDDLLSSEIDLQAQLEYESLFKEGGIGDVPEGIVDGEDVEDSENARDTELDGEILTHHEEDELLVQICNTLEEEEEPITDPSASVDQSTAVTLAALPGKRHLCLHQVFVLTQIQRTFTR